MIVYAGKQFWNEFNNGDEALFQDADRPRDDDKFKIRPWMQSDKWDWRWTNKNINMAQALVRCIVKNPSWTFTTPYFKTEYADDDFSFIEWYTPNWWSAISSAEAIQLARESKIQTWQWDACIAVSDGNVIIKKSWTYIIEAFAEFVYPTWYDVGSSYQYIEYVALKAYKDNQWRVVLGATDRACWSRSYRKASYVTNAVAGDILNLETGQTSWYETLVNVWLNAYRLG